MLKKIDNPKMLLLSRWSSAKIGKNNSEYFGADNLYMMMNYEQNKSVLDLYDQLLEETNDKSYATLRSILSTKNVRLFYFKANNMVLFLERAFSDFMDSPKININFKTIERVEELKNIALKNFVVSRDSFLDKQIECGTPQYDYIFSNNDCSFYCKTDDGCMFNLSNDEHVDDMLFSFDSVSTIINKSNSNAWYEEFCDRRICDFVIHVSNKTITLKNIPIYLKTALIREINNHNTMVNSNKTLVLKGGSHE